MKETRNEDPLVPPVRPWWRAPGGGSRARAGEDGRRPPPGPGSPAPPGQRRSERLLLRADLSAARGQSGRDARLPLHEVRGPEGEDRRRAVPRADRVLAPAEGRGRPPEGAEEGGPQ